MISNAHFGHTTSGQEIMRTKGHGSDRLITVVCSTLNASKTLPDLISSLRGQTDQDFDWIVADGGSVDGTISLCESAVDLLPVVLRGPDFGIYDGLNRAIAQVTTEYYLVLGADDTLNPTAIANYKSSALMSHADLISAKVNTTNGEVLVPNRGSLFRYGHLAYISQHAVGTLIRKSLHDKIGMYSRKYPIAADRHFVLKCMNREDTTIQFADFLAGTYSTEGTSNIQFYNALLDIFKVDYELTKHPLRTAVISLFRYAINLLKMRSR